MNHYTKLLEKIVMKESLMQKLGTQFEELQAANMLTAKAKAKELMHTTYEIMQHQARVNAAVQKLLQDGFDHRKELVQQIAELKAVHSDNESEEKPA
jgi:uncharacterized protein YdaT